MMNHINYYQHMITKHLKLKSLTNVAKFFFSGAHHKVYDWRDDHDANPSYELDSRQVNTKDPAEYTFPHTADAEPWIFVHPDNYNPKDLTQNLVCSLKPAKFYNMMSSPQQTDRLGDIAHEMDYQSQDLDFQAESFKTQHFRKKGAWMGWVVGCSIPIWFVVSELFVQGWSDQDAYRYQRAPPLQYPDEQETPDAVQYLLFQTKEYNQFYDAGLVKRPYFKIQDGKKIYTKYAGVNEPYPVPNL